MAEPDGSTELGKRRLSEPGVSFGMRGGVARERTRSMVSSATAMTSTLSVRSGGRGPLLPSVPFVKAVPRCSEAPPLADARGDPGPAGDVAALALASAAACAGSSPET